MCEGKQILVAQQLCIDQFVLVEVYNAIFTKPSQVQSYQTTLSRTKTLFLSKEENQRTALLKKG